MNVFNLNLMNNWMEKINLNGNDFTAFYYTLRWKD